MSDRKVCAVQFQKNMTEAKFLVGVASFASLASILAILIVVPTLYSRISEIQDRVNDQVQVSFGVYKQLKIRDFM